MLKEVILYCDGACSGNLGPAVGAACLIIKETERAVRIFARYDKQPYGALWRPFRAFLALKERCSVRVFTDSAYIHNAFDKGWIIAWQNNGWKTASKKPGGKSGPVETAFE